MADATQEVRPDDREERESTLAQFEHWIEKPMRVLGFIWLGLLIIEFTRGRSTLVAVFSTIIWIIFIIDFVVRLILAPDKSDYFKHNWLIEISLIVPALRVFSVFAALRFLRAARLARGFRLVRVISSLNRGMSALGRSMKRRGLGYVLALSTIITFGGAAAMYYFEQGVPNDGIANFGSALWWTAMVMTTLGSNYWPQSGEGRVLCLLLAFYAFAVWGYVTASLSSYFVGRDADNDEAEVPGKKEIESLRAELAGLRDDIRSMRQPAR
ncbi:MAG TPA: ion transporter [Gemmatimonadaceae bacterium]|jgi:voltage-gated potassium channel|nr:ion transporter [Gemmatimonadaceae bacterium]